jgi:hypothetical protein
MSWFFKKDGLIPQFNRRLSSAATIVVFIYFVVFLCFFVFLCLVVFLYFFVFLCFFVFLYFVVFFCCNLLFTITLSELINIYVKGISKEKNDLH